MNELEQVIRSEMEMRKDLRDYVFDKIDRRLNNLEEFREYQINNSNKPHKCPVCDGECRKFLKEPLVTDNLTSYSMSCAACAGKGIVWGKY